MLVSVIIPNYNHEKYLDERIQSILNQTYDDFEIIILDDKSKDNSKNIIEKYRNNKHVTHIVYNDTNSGSTFKQWEKGFELAKGDLIWIAESDDSCNCNFLESLIPKFDNKEVVLAFTQSMQIDEKGNELGIFETQEFMDKDIELGGSDFICQHLSQANIIVNASSALIRKDVLSRISRDFMSYRGCGDWLFWIFIAEMGIVSYIAQPLNLFRQHISNTTHKLDVSGNNPIEVYQIYQFLSIKGYLGQWRKVWFRASRLPTYRFGKLFRDKTIRDRILSVWNFHTSDYLLILIYSVYFYSKSAINVIRRKWKQL